MHPPTESDNARQSDARGRLAGRVAAITGGASGMGRATVRRFLEEGARVAVADLNEAHGADLLAELEGAGWGERSAFFRVDVAEEDQVADWIDRVLERFGRLDVVFNNAGLGGAFGPITEIEVEHWDYTFAVLVRGVFLGTKYAARAMRAQGEGDGGSIINTASVAGLCGGNGPQAYSAAKAAVVNFSQTAAVELAPARVRVNAICPGGILTPLMHQGDPEGATRMMLEAQPWPAVGEGIDIANAALFLASDESRFVTGQILTVDGGLMAAGPHLNGRVAGTDRAATLVGVNRGSTGQQHSYRRLGKRDAGRGVR